MQNEHLRVIILWAMTFKWLIMYMIYKVMYFDGNVGMVKASKAHQDKHMLQKSVCLIRRTLDGFSSIKPSQFHKKWFEFLKEKNRVNYIDG